MSGPGENLVELRFPSKAERLRLVRTLVKDTATLCGCSEECADDIVLAVNEACMNVIQHCYQRDPDQEIVLEIWQNNGSLIFRLVDFGDPVEPATVKPRDLDDLRPGGLGTHFIQEIMDDMAFLPPPDGAGNMLQLVKRIG